MVSFVIYSGMAAPWKADTGEMGEVATESILADRVRDPDAPAKRLAKR